MRRLVCLAAMLIAVAGAGAAYSRSALTPRTLVLAHGTISAFAQDGGRIAWATSERTMPCPWHVRIRVLATNRQRIINPNSGPTCHSDTGFDTSVKTYLALAGERALWTLYESGNFTYLDLMTASYSKQRDVQLEELIFENGFYDGDHLGGLAGDGSTLAYGVATVGVAGLPNCEDAGGCTEYIAGGRVERVHGTSRSVIPGASPPAALAASGGRIALIVAGTAGYEVSAGVPAKVDVVNAASGALAGSFSPVGKPLTIALSSVTVALLATTPSGKRIEFYSLAGVLRRSVAVPVGATDLSMTGTRAVFRVGRQIRSVRVASGGMTTLATAAATPVGLSIEGERVAWAENVRVRGVLRGRIRAITVI